VGKHGGMRIWPASIEGNEPWTFVRANAGTRMQFAFYATKLQGAAVHVATSAIIDIAMGRMPLIYPERVVRQIADAFFFL
jgi:hypothetical protein